MPSGREKFVVNCIEIKPEKIADRILINAEVHASKKMQQNIYGRSVIK